VVGTTGVWTFQINNAKEGCSSDPQGIITVNFGFNNFTCQLTEYQWQI